MMLRRSGGSRRSAVVAAAVLGLIAAGPAVGESAAQSAAQSAAESTAQSTAPFEQLLEPDVPAAQTPSAGERQAPAPTDNPVLKLFAGTQLMGFLDTYYSYNFNTPKTPCSLAAGVQIFNCLHAFDVAHNALSLNAAELAIEKKPTSDSRVGYRLDFDYGAGAALVARFEPGGSTPIYQNVQQAYISYLARSGNGLLQIDFGKFVTPAGFEVIDSKDNWNYSRGLLFTLAIPRYHQGLRAVYSLNDKATITAFVVNGWNNSVENNGAKSLGVQVIGKPTRALAVTASYIGGPEIPDDNRDWRHLFDVVATYTVNPTVSIAVNYDVGKELSTTWQGAAAYLKYQPKAWLALSSRYELFNDHDGWALIGQNEQELTLTGELKYRDGVAMRVEYRGDLTQDPFFLKNTSEEVKAQKVLTLALVYTFSSKKTQK